MFGFKKIIHPQNGDFEIENGVLEKYKGREAHVTIPDSVKEIESDNVFDEDVVIRGKKGSEAERYAEEKGIVFMERENE